MRQFLLNFYHFPVPKNEVPSTEAFKAINKQWQDYVGGIAAQGKFAGTQRLEQAGTIIGPDKKRSDVVSDGKGLIVGTLTLRADSLDEAVELAKDCPVLAVGGSLEVRPVLAFDL